MSDTDLDNVDRKLLSLLQTGFPLTREPYGDLGIKLGISSDEIIHCIHQLKVKGVVRQISPVLDARRLGYQGTLVAMKIANDRIERAEQFLNEHQGVSHGYERDHDFKIWITLYIPHEVDMQAELQRLLSLTGAETIFTLPAIKVFKLRTNFGLDDDNHLEADITAGSNLPKKVELTQLDRRVINELQQDLPLTSDPFNALSGRLNMRVDTLLQHCRSLLQRGIIRRYGASINHYRAGYKANAMTCWTAPPDKVDTIGRKLASLKQVSHCYERKTNTLWHYNLFVMIHSHTRMGCRDIVSKISVDTGLSDYAILFSTREFKKTRIKYLV